MDQSNLHDWEWMSCSSCLDLKCVWCVLWILEMKFINFKNVAGNRQNLLWFISKSKYWTESWWNEHFFAFKTRLCFWKTLSRFWSLWCLGSKSLITMIVILINKYPSSAISSMTVSANNWKLSWILSSSFESKD